MSDFCYDASEHIARKYPRADVSEIDRFLAQQNRRQFKLHDIEDFTHVTEYAEGIVNEYIARRIIALETRYFCPKHKNTVLERSKKLILGRRRICPKCEKSYSVDGLETENIFVRKKEPDRPLPSDVSITGEATEKPEKRFLKDPKWLIEKIVLPIVLPILLTIITGLLILPVLQRLQTASSMSSITSTPVSSATWTHTPLPTTVPTRAHFKDVTQESPFQQVE